jgi:sugar phosphate isomerase/epimerase
MAVVCALWKRTREDKVRRLGLEYISVFGLPPVEFVNLAADLGCASIGTGLEPLAGYNPYGYPTWSLGNDRALRRDMTAAMRDRSISVSLVEGFFVMPMADVGDHAANLDVVCELDAKRINTLGLDRDRSRSFDQFAKLADLAAARGLEVTLEFGPRMAVADLPTALAAVRHVGRPNFRLLLDTMHLVRSGSGAAEVAALEPAAIGYVQLCDAPSISRFSEYTEEAKYERMAPGTGELPLLDILGVLPPDLPISLEVPQRSLAQGGVGPHERLRKCVEATHNLLSRLEHGAGRDGRDSAP